VSAGARTARAGSDPAAGSDPDARTGSDPRIEAFIFDIDGTIIESMPYHNRSWPIMLARHGLGAAAADLVRSSPGRTGVELMREIFGADLPLERAHALVDEKESIYRELFGAEFREVA